MHIYGNNISLAMALQFLHEKGIVHMDLKPQNLLLSGGEKPLLKVAGKLYYQKGCVCV